MAGGVAGDAEHSVGRRAQRLDGAIATLAPDAELVSITGTRHDALNNMTHRTAAAIIVLFLERLRQDGHRAPIAITELP